MNSAKLAQNDLDLFSMEYESKKLSAHKFLNQLYKKFKNNKSEEAVLPAVYNTYLIKRNLDAVKEQFRLSALSMIAVLNVVRDNTLSFRHQEAMGTIPGGQERDKAIADAHRAVEEHERLKIEADALQKDYQSSLVKLKSTWKTARASLWWSRRWLWLINSSLWLLKNTAGFIFTLISLGLAWNLDKLSEHAEHHKSFDLGLPGFLHEHFYFFLFFFIVELVFDFFKDKLKDAVFDAIRRFRFHNLESLFDRFQKIRASFLNNHGLTEDVINQMLNDFLFNHK